MPLENRAAIRVYGSGMTPASLRAMSRAAHGIALHPLAAFAPYLEGTALPSIAETGASPAIAAWCVTSVHPDAGRAMREARARLALYLSVPGLGRVADGTPWKKDVARLRQAAPAHHGRPDWAALGELVPPDLAEELAVVGSPDEAAEKLASRREGLGGAASTNSSCSRRDGRYGRAVAGGHRGDRGGLGRRLLTHRVS